MSNFHDIRIEPIKNFAKGAKVYIDGIPIRCRSYLIQHGVDRIPRVSLDVNAIPDIVHRADVMVGNKAEIARLMDEKEFQTFCDTWHRIHEDEK